MADETDLKQEDDSLELLVQEDNAPAPVKKVELDLDDAPFLQAEEKNLPTPAHADIVPDAPEDDGNKKKRKKKLLILAGAACGVLVIGAAAAWWFFFRSPPPAVVAGVEPEVIVVPGVPANTEPSEIVRPFAPFIIPYKEGENKTHFLVCKFSVITKNPGINRELDQQRIALRDAIYYYLRSKGSAFLLNAHNGPEIKKELLTIFNDYLTQGQLEDVLFESYLSS